MRSIQSAWASGWANKRVRRRSLSSASLSAVTVMWPILRAFRLSALPYKCTAAPGTVRALSAILSMASIVDEAPRMLTMAADGTRRAVEPRGKERMARRWFSNWEVRQASMV